jgi:hypothetical protein
MSAFRKRPPVPKLARRVPRPWDPPETEFPALVPISTLQFDRSEQTAIAITGVWAYSNGFEFFVTRLIRPDARGFDEDPVPGAPRGTLAERQSFQISFAARRTAVRYSNPCALQPSWGGHQRTRYGWSAGGRISCLVRRTRGPRPAHPSRCWRHTTRSLSTVRPGGDLFLVPLRWPSQRILRQAGVRCRS